MVDLTTRITNLTTAVLLLFQISLSDINFADELIEIKNDIADINFLKERPGIQNITYVVKVDWLNEKNLIGSMCKRAL